MKVHRDCEQGDLNWLRKHMGIPTAGGMGNLLDTQLNARTGEMVKTYVQTKIAESWRGKPLIELNSKGSFSTEQGMILEEEARPWLALETGKKITTVGFITTDDGLCGCSPDGIIEEMQCGVEIKSPAAHTHCKYLLGGTVPKDYIVQVHAGLYVTQFPRWLFVSYRRGFPALLVMVERDPKIDAKIKEAVDKFHLEFSAGLDRIKQVGEENAKLKW